MFGRFNLENVMLVMKSKMKSIFNLNFLKIVLILNIPCEIFVFKQQILVLNKRDFLTYVSFKNLSLDI